MGAAVLMAASITLPNGVAGDREQAPRDQVGPSSGSSHAPTFTPNSKRSHSTSGSNSGRSSASPHASASRVPLDPGVQLPTQAISFRLAITTSSGVISANVGSISVVSNQPVDPPHDTAEEWNTAVWVRQSAYPSAQSRGTTYVYGHACHYHQCPFTQLKDAQVGDLVRVTLPTSALTFQIERSGLSPKAASALPAWASDSTVQNRIVLVTCAFEQGDTSTNNIVVVAKLR
jgi:hypothetical protein